MKRPKQFAFMSHGASGTTNDIREAIQWYKHGLRPKGIYRLMPLKEIEKESKPRTKKHAR